jgi:uncharacterized membrane protein YagU involved in acid resistance
MKGKMNIRQRDGLARDTLIKQAKSTTALFNWSNLGTKNTGLKYWEAEGLVTDYLNCTMYFAPQFVQCTVLYSVIFFSILFNILYCTMESFFCK